MFTITEKKLCSGCSACENICPKQAIIMNEDAEGAIYPCVDKDKCINCGLCEKVCPFKCNDLNLLNNTEKPLFFAAQLKDKIELQNVSSGGAFWGLVQYILSKKGLVYGAVQENVDHITHIRVDNLENAKKLRRSKYFQSSTSEIYSNVKKDLNNGKIVLFSGVPCQIAALKSFLGKKYENLFTCEVVCHGVPVKNAWRSYRKEKEQKLSKRIVDLVFRDKSKGWSRNQYKLTYDDGSEEYEASVTNFFHRGYLEGLIYRPSCGNCHFSKIPRVADLTLADYWQYKGRLNKDCNMGVSLVSVNNDHGLSILDKSREFLEIEKTSRINALKSCRHLNNSPLENPNRDEFIGNILKYGYHKAYEMFFNSMSDNNKNALQQSIQENSNMANKVKKSFVFRLKQTIITTLGRITKKCFRYKTEEIDFIREYYENIIERNVVFDFELLKSLKALFGKNDILFLSENRLLRFLFRLRGCERGNIAGQLKIAKLFLAFRDACILLAKKGIPVYFYNRVGLKKDGFQYSETAKNRMKNHLSFPLMYENIEKYEKDLKELFGDKYTKEYVQEIGKIPQVVQVGDYYCHEDCKSRYVNVINGKRITCFQPKVARRTIHIYGRCGAFGYAVEDSETLPSQIQKELVENGVNDIKVVNHGLWGGENDLIDSNFFKDSMKFGQNDIVLFYRMHFDKRIIAKLEQLGLWYHEITEDWHKFPEAKSCFYDKPGHMNAVGYRNAAKLIVEDLIKHDFKNKEVASIMLDGFTNRYLTVYLKNSRNVKFDEEIEEYLNSIKAKYPNDSINNAGAIVMNCNPFTFGHRHLIEYASKMVERLYIFVVEEDKSFFKFADRFDMVKNGVADLRNIVVIPSGKFIISAFTFPEYFMKDYVKEKNFDVSSDIQIFCKYIAPALNIKTRFAGEEPFDPVTSNYNETMRKILPEYAMTFCEIPRFKTENEEVINATKVRELLRQKDFEKLKEFVPDSTLKILKEKYIDN